MPDSSTDNSKLFGGSKDYSWARLICGTIPLIIWLPGNHKAYWMINCWTRLVNGYVISKKRQRR